MPYNRIETEMVEKTNEGGFAVLGDDFSKWFGDSRIVCKDGTPLIVYHGTLNDFDKFDMYKIGESSGNNGFLGRGFYFTADLEKARAYGNIIIHACLRMENPFVINGILDKETARIINEVSETYAFDAGMTHRDVYNSFSYSVPEYPEIAEAVTTGLQNYWYDGIIYGNYEEIVCFCPEQIRIIRKEVN
jgi:hypothetical protein